MPEGGALFDFGVYNVITLTGLLGPAKRVMAMSGVDIPERVVDGAMTEVRVHNNAQILLDFGAGVYAAITTGFTIQEYRCPGIKLYGTAGTIQTIGEDWAPRGYELWQNSDGCWQVYDDRGIWPWTDGLRDLIEAIHEDRPPMSNVEHAYHGLEIMIDAMAALSPRAARTATTTWAIGRSISSLAWRRTIWPQANRVSSEPRASSCLAPSAPSSGGEPRGMMPVG